MSEEKEAPAGDADIKSDDATAPEAEAEQKKKAARKTSRRARERKDDDRPAEAKEPKDEAEKPEESEESKPSEDAEEGGASRRGRGRRGGAGRARKTASESRRPTTPVDSKELGKKAWQLYKADIAEEGIELVKDSDGQKLAKRSFDLAKIFLDECARRAPMPPKSD